MNPSKNRLHSVLWGCYPLGSSRGYNHRLQRWAARHLTVWPYVTAAQFASFRALMRTLELLGLLRLTTYRGAFDEYTLTLLRKRRDLYAEVDRLQIVADGLAQLGLASTLEAHVANVSSISSPLTNPRQRPSQFYVPGVRAQAWYDVREFEWVARAEAAYPEIREEVIGLLTEDLSSFAPYPGFDGKTGWKVFPLFMMGDKIEANCRKCPQTTRFLESIPRLFKYHVMFGLLRGKSAIPVHCGISNLFVRSHLGLKVPDGSWLRVDTEKKYLKEGKVTGAFDESFEHEAGNESAETRIVLYIDVWNPRLSDSDIEVIDAACRFDTSCGVVRRWHDAFTGLQAA